MDARADEFFAAFARADQALAAAVRVQGALQDRVWPGGLEIRVRIGLHSGEPARTETGYVGLPVNIGSRVCDAGHGGQILLSGATFEALDRPAGDVDLVALGEIRTAWPSPASCSVPGEWR